MRIFEDGNAIGHACHNATKLSHNGMATQAIYGFIRSLRDLRVGFPDANITVLWDGYAKHRFAAFPEYKEDREKRLEDPAALAERESYRAQVPVIKKAVELLGVNQLMHPDYEADDLAGLLCSKYGSTGEDIRLVTGDSDWSQLVKPNIDWFDPRKEGKLITWENFQQMTGYFTPDEYLEGKTLIGDPTDSIPGIDGIGPKTAVEFIAKWKSVDRFWEAVDSGSYTPAQRKSKAASSPHPEQSLAYPQGREIVRRNRVLMDLRTVKIENPAAIQLTKGEFSPEKFKILCARLGFVSVTRNYADWVQPFNK